MEKDDKNEIETENGDMDIAVNANDGGKRCAEAYHDTARLEDRATGGECLKTAGVGGGAPDTEIANIDGGVPETETDADDGVLNTKTEAAREIFPKGLHAFLTKFMPHDRAAKLIACVLKSGVTGIFTGIIVFFFRMGYAALNGGGRYIYGLVAERPVFIPLLFLGLVILAAFMAAVLKFAPDSAGGGIPRSEGVVRGLLTFKWLRTLIASVAGSFISFFAGLPLGTEGPCVQIGAAVSEGNNAAFKTVEDNKRYVRTAGVAAGFAAATAAPIAALVFATEEANQKYDPFLVLSAGIGVLTAMAVASALSYAFGISGAFLEMGTIPALPLQYIWSPLLIGAFAGIAAAVFNKLTARASAFFRDLLGKSMKNTKFKSIERFVQIKRLILLIAVFAATGLLGLFWGDATGSGDKLITVVSAGKLAWYVLLILLIVKTVFIIFSTSSGAVGGLFMPMLTLGAITGGLAAEALTAAGVPDVYYPTLVAIGVCAFIGGAIRAPVTAVVLIIEATGSIVGGLYSIMAVFASITVLAILRVDSVNDLILAQLLTRKSAKSAENSDENSQIVAAVPKK